MRALEHRALGHWLRDLEKLVRRAIRADARALDLPALKTRARRAKPGPPQSNEDMPRFHRSYSDDCTTWKVSFRMSVALPGKNRGPRERSEPAERRRCRPHAFRIEALRRAINSREDYVLRYARRLARIAVMSSITAPNVRDLHGLGRDPSPPATSAVLSEATPPQTARPSAKHIEPG